MSSNILIISSILIMTLSSLRKDYLQKMIGFILSLVLIAFNFYTDPLELFIIIINIIFLMLTLLYSYKKYHTEQR